MNAHPAPHRPGPLLLLGSAALLAACAATSRPAATATVAASTPGASSASDGWTGPAPDAQRLLADVAWLADDAREGRRAGTASADESARWIAARFQELGLQPAGEEGFYQELTVPLAPRDGGGSTVSWIPERQPGRPPTWTRNMDRDVAPVPLFCSEGGSVDGPLDFRGYGLRAEDPGDGSYAWDDYAGADLTGRVVLVVRGTPRTEKEEGAGEGAAEPAGGAPAHGEAADTSLVGRDPSFGSSASIFAKVMNARRHGAVAVIVAQHPDDLGQPLLAFDAGSSARASIPAVTIDAALAERLAPGYAESVRMIDRQGMPVAAAPLFLSGQVQVHADVIRENATTSNVLARLPGTGDAPTIVVGAHYDHLGRGGTGSLSPADQGQIHNGADDNASGTAAVLEMARLLAEAPEPPPGDVVFALWSGEELGLLGSEHWMKQPTIPLESVGANLNLDMVGRAGAGVLQVLGAGTSPAFEGWMESAGAAAGLELRVSLSGQGLGGSDHQSFLKRRIPALHLFSGVHEDYHRPSDDTERFEAGGAARVVALGLDLVGRMQAEGELPFVQPEIPESAQKVGDAGWSVWFGSVPDYAWEGEGLRISGTSPGSPAERAGLLADDRVVGFGDVPIDNIYDLVYALQVYKPGDVVLVRYVRDGEEQEVRVTLVPRGIQ